MTDNQKNLAAPFRPDQIKTRQGRSGQQLAYVEVADVIDRLNAALPSWSFEVVSHQVLDDEVVVHARLRAGDVVKEDFGAHELTKSRHDGTTVCVGDDLKSAASDALKRCARLMGVALDLYRGGGDAAPHAPTPIRRPVQLATDAQVSKLRALSAQRRVDLDAAVFDRFGVTAADLTKSDASALIDELLGKNNGARVNGQAHRHA
jgi:hypothetical protein